MIQTVINESSRRTSERSSLANLIQGTKQSDAALKEVPLEEVKFSKHGLLHRGQLLPIDDAARRRIYRMLKAPASYLEKFSDEFQAAVLSEHARTECRKSKSGQLAGFGAKPVAVVEPNGLLAIVPGELVNLPNSDVISAVGETLGEEGSQLFVTRIRNDVERFEVDLASPAKATIVRRGDIVQAGISIIHCRYGLEATQIQSYMLRCVCDNGMVRKECASCDGVKRTRRIDVTADNGRELQMNQIRRIVRQTWDGLQAQLDAFRETSERRVNVEELLKRRLLQVRISWPLLGERLLAAWRAEGAENTLFGAVNALTWVATHDSSIRESRRRVLASLAGLLAFSRVDVCPKCLSILARSAGEDGDSA